MLKYLASLMARVMRERMSCGEEGKGRSCMGRGREGRVRLIGERMSRGVQEDRRRSGG